MRVGIMQPYIFPYLGYFDLINKSDQWIVFDTPQYIRHGWINRNRILHPTSGWQYFIVPVKKHRRETPINEIEIAKSENWQEKIFGQLNHYRKKARFFSNTVEFIKSCFDNNSGNLAEFNTNIIKKICELLKIDTEIKIFSKMNISINSVEVAGDWALRICETLGAESYINPPGGENIFDKSAFVKSNIKLIIQDFKNINYPVRGYEFIEGLSIIDVLMWNHLSDIKYYLDNQL